MYKIMNNSNIKTSKSNVILYAITGFVLISIILGIIIAYVILNNKDTKTNTTNNSKSSTTSETRNRLTNPSSTTTSETQSRRLTATSETQPLTSSATSETRPRT